MEARQRSRRAYAPAPGLMEEMGQMMQQMMARGVLLDTNGLYPTAPGARLRFATDGATQVIDGPFAETKELVAGYWIIQVKSKEEAIERFRSCPFQVGEIELRQIFESADFEPAIHTAEGRSVLEAEEAFRSRAA